MTLRRSLQTLLILAGLAGVPLWMGGCNTVKGAGEDVESVGEGIQGAAEGASNGR